MDGADAKGVEGTLNRIRAEYLEMPGLRVTRAQAERLWGLDDAECEQLLELLVTRKFLCRTESGRYARLTDDPVALTAHALSPDIKRVAPGRTQAWGTQCPTF